MAPRWGYTLALCAAVGTYSVQGTCLYNSCSNRALYTCSLHDCTQRSIIDLHESQLWGTIPSSLGSLTQLAYAIELFTNQLTGTLPPSLGSLTNLNHYLGLGSNSFTGTIPSSYGSLEGLEHHINLQINELTGTLPPSLGSLTNLRDGISVIANSLTGTIPPSFSNVEDAKYMYLASNAFTGTIPSWFGSLQSMTNVRLNDNKFTGTLPPSLGSLTNVESHFYMNDNLLTGLIPDSICPLVHDIAGYCDLSGDLMFWDCPFPSGCSAVLSSKCDAECDVTPTDCVGAWGGWGGCSATCGGGESRRTFYVTTPAEHGGTSCSHDAYDHEDRLCNTASCMTAPAPSPTTDKPDENNDELVIIVAAASASGVVVLIVIVAVVIISMKKKTRSNAAHNKSELQSVVSERPSTYVTSSQPQDRITSM